MNWHQTDKNHAVHLRKLFSQFCYLFYSKQFCNKQGQINRTILHKLNTISQFYPLLYLKLFRKKTEEKKIMLCNNVNINSNLQFCSLPWNKLIHNKIWARSLLGNPKWTGTKKYILQHIKLVLIRRYCKDQKRQQGEKRFTLNKLKPLHQPK